MDDPVPSEPLRAQARAQLRSLAEQGLLGPAELDQQLAALEEIDGAVSVPMAGLLGAPGYRPDDRLVLVAGMSAERRRGPWTVPPFVLAHPAASNVRLDCREATAAAPVIDVEITGGMGSVVLVVPEGWAVNVDRLAKQAGSISVKAADTPSRNCPLILVHGTSGLGRFKARTRSRSRHR